MAKDSGADPADFDSGELRESLAWEIAEQFEDYHLACIPAGRAADAILSLPAMRNLIELSERCYLHDGPGGVSVQMRAADSATPQPQS